MTSVRYRTFAKRLKAPVAGPKTFVYPARHDRICRVVNVVAAAVGIVLAAPLMVLIAVVIKLTSKGGVIFSQTRVGINRRNGAGGYLQNKRRRQDYGGVPFTIYKFRTMYDAMEQQHETWASPWDPRVTRFGRRLRKYRLDELPQLFNVLRGDMNLVGPRPEQPRIFAKLRYRIAGYGARQQVLPGITGWAQVRLHYDASMDDVERKVELDLKYIAERSPLRDLKIMAMTVPVVVFQRGAW